MSAAKSAQPETKAGGTRERILDATAAVMREKGFAGTRLSDIARLAELQAATIYYYFPSREDVIEEVIRVGQVRTNEHVRAALKALSPSASGIDRIEAAVTAHLQVVLTISDYAAASIRNFGQLPVDMRVRQNELRREYGAMWRELVDGAIEAGEISSEVDSYMIRQLIVGSLNWTTEWWTPDRGAEAEVIRNALHLVRQGILGSPQHI